MFVVKKYELWNKKNSSTKVNNNNIIKMNVLEFMIHKHMENV